MGMVSYIREEIAVIRERDPAIKTTAEVFLYPSFKAILHYRAAHKLYPVSYTHLDVYKRQEMERPLKKHVILGILIRESIIGRNIQQDFCGRKRSWSRSGQKFL